MRLTDRGKICDAKGSTPTVTWTNPTDLTFTATYTLGSDQITITSTGGFAMQGIATTTIIMQAGMPVSGTGIDSQTVVSSCSSATTCTLSKITNVASNTAPEYTLTVKACSIVPQAAISCSQDSSDMIDFRQANTYTFDSVSGALTDSTVTTGGSVVMSINNFGLSRSAKYSNIQFGPFFEGTAENKAALACDWDKNVACSWKAWEVLDTFYMYSTGPGAQRVSMIDSANNPVIFDEPVVLMYTHSGHDSNSNRDYDGVSMILRYNGPGDLQGFPQVCLNSNMERTDCVQMGASATTAFPDITLASSVVLTDLDGRKYYTKAAQLQERYPKAASGSDAATACTSSLTFANVPAVPDLAALFVKPRNADQNLPTEAELESGYLNGGKPMVIGGVTMYELQALAAAA